MVFSSTFNEVHYLQRCVVHLILLFGYWKSFVSLMAFTSLSAISSLCGNEPEFPVQCNYSDLSFVSLSSKAMQVQGESQAASEINHRENALQIAPIPLQTECGALDNSCAACVPVKSLKLVEKSNEVQLECNTRLHPVAPSTFQVLSLFIVSISQSYRCSRNLQNRQKS